MAPSSRSRGELGDALHERSTRAAKGTLPARSVNLSVGVVPRVHLVKLASTRGEVHGTDGGISITGGKEGGEVNHRVDRRSEKKKKPR